MDVFLENTREEERRGEKTSEEGEEEEKEERMRKAEPKRKVPGSSTNVNSLTCCQIPLPAQIFMTVPVRHIETVMVIKDHTNTIKSNLIE